MKKSVITFAQLQKYIANIDYVWEESYPVHFGVENDGREDTYIAGIDDLWEDEVPIIFEQQYVSRYGEVIDLQEPDAMEFNAIGEMLRKKCNISDNSVIYLYKDESFTGVSYGIDYNDLTPEVQQEVEEWLNSI